MKFRPHSQVRLVRQQKWLAAIATAFFLLQAPFCALACLRSSPTAPMDAAEHGDSPCHEEAPSPARSAPTNSHDDCGCADSYTALAQSVSQTPPDVTNLVHLAPGFSLRSNHASSPWVRRSQPRDDLPPPDVLLLKSTLLI